MKARIIKKLRRKIISKGYYVKRADSLSKELESLHDFYRFKCDWFFVGSERAEFNLMIYNRKSKGLSGKLDWYMKRIK